jgi:cbb3-type cytochrome oxidase cytochrome c subunit
VSQIEHGKITELDAVRAYVEALGGTVDVLARVGDWTVKVA